MASILFRHLKKILVIIIGGTVLLVGIILIFLPGPSFIVIPAGLAILAIEFSWARTLLKRAQNAANAKIFSFLSWRRKKKADRSPGSAARLSSPKSGAPRLGE